MTVLNVLLVDDDPESLKPAKGIASGTIERQTIRWEPCGTFEDAFQRIAERRFDVVVTDIYRDRKGKKEPVTGDPQGRPSCRKS